VNDAPAAATPSAAQEPSGSRGELKAFLFLTVVMAPVISFFIITGYGFLVWIYQMLVTGPPTH
jgi:nitrate reductase NapE